MGKTKPTPVKTQQSISNFFTKKTVNGEALSQQAQSPQNPPPTRRESNDGENLYDAETEEDEPLRPLANGALKRQLTNSKDTEEVARPTKRARGEENDESGSFFAETAQSKPTSVVSAKSKVSPRTERYLYTRSSQTTPGKQIPEEEGDEATKAQKKALHEKFVKKLGHPDSIAMIKRKNWQIDADTEALDEDGGDDEDGEDETPPPTKTKKKGAKTGKLTPMELQILDIKRKHMDTLLIVEVGYKFKFYGEDARIAAKELHIVCIPGKYRYDERGYPQTFSRTSLIAIRSVRGTSRPLCFRQHPSPPTTRTCEETRCRWTQDWSC